MPLLGGLKNISKPKCCKIRWRDIYTREVLACMACLSLSVFLLFGVATPWYTITGYGLAPPQDTVQTIYYWPGMENIYVPPLRGERAVHLSWDAMDTRMPKDVYMSSMAMGILAWVATQVLLVAIMFGLICKGTGRMFYLLSCGLFKWVVVLVCFVVLVLVLLSWTIFFVFNKALSEAKLCYGNPTYYPSGNVTVPCEGFWCSGFAGTSVAGGARFAWGPSAGWVSVLCGTIHIFFILCVVLSVDPYKFGSTPYEEIGEKRKKKKKLAVKKRSPEEIKLARQRSRMAEEYDDEDSEEEERRPLRRSTHGGGSRSDGGRNPKRASRRPRDEDIEEEFSERSRASGRGRGRRSSRRV